MACGRADRAAGVGAERKIAQSVRYRRRRPRARAASHAIRRSAIARCTEVRILAGHREREFLRTGFSREGGAGCEQGVDNRRVRRLDAGHGQHVRVAAAGRVTGHIEDVLYAERQARERAARGMGYWMIGVGYESAIRGEVWCHFVVSEWGRFRSSVATWRFRRPGCSGPNTR